MTTFGPYPAIVDKVVDGDTIHLRLDLGFDLTVYARARVAGINAPELDTPEGKAARDFARVLLPAGAPVTVISHGWDKYGGRIDADIETLGGDFAGLMVDAAHAKLWDGKGVRP